MRECRKKQIELERDYINTEYLSDIKSLTDYEKVDKRCSKCDVLFNNKPYELYRYELNGIRLMPKTEGLFKGDFDDIYDFHYTKGHGVLFEILRKQNGIIENYYYLFTVNDDYYCKDYMSAEFSYSTINDSGNKLYEKYLEENVSEELFLSRRGYNRLDLNKNESIVELKKYDDGMCEVHQYNSYNGFKDNMKLDKINLDESQSLLNVALEISKGTKIKRR